MGIHLGGTIRARKTSETLKIIQPYIKRAGITRIANLTYLDCLEIPVYTCIRPQSNNLTTSQGKGITDDLAMCSAYMEAIEHYFSEFVEPDLIADITEIDQDARIKLDDLPAGMIQCDDRDKHIKNWNLCESLLGERALYFPSNFFSFNLQNACMENSFFRKTTTGLASGNNLVEATCHALYECIERHCQFEFTHMPFEQKMQRLLDVDSVDYSEAVYIIQKLKDNHVDCAIFELTNEMNIPTYHAIIADDNPFRKLGHYSGSGTHINAGIAICRALTEAVQSRLTYIAGSRDDMFPKDYKMSWKPLELKGEKRFVMENEAAAFDLDSQQNHLLKQLKKNHCHPYRYEHTKPEDKISVVKVMIEGIKL